MPSPAPETAGGQRGLRAFLSLLLVAGTAATYAEVGGLGFIPGDDQVYVSENPQVLPGLTGEGVWWALTSLDHANWHPLAWLSHMLDVQLFGVEPGGHHLVNVALHALNAVLCFLVLERFTGARWRSFLVAALFAVHPLHVESVAWIAERKDLLAGTFFFLTVGCHLWRLRRPGARSPHWVTACFALGLMAKPMLVTLPLLLLLLDHWPLGRVRPAGGAREYLRTLRPLVREKLPLLALSLLDSLVTLAAQSRFGAVASLGAADPASRVGNALVSCVAYLGKALWPARLAFFYPFPQGGVAPWQALGAGALLAALTALALRERLRRPWLLVGWLWFLGMLVPVLGLVQVGAQAMADRYTYLPLSGAFIAAIWCLPAGRTSRSGTRAAAVCLALLALGTLSAAARAQARIWRDGATLYRHALAVTGGDALTHLRLGRLLAERGEWDEALANLREAVRFAPDAARQAYGVGLLLEDLGRTAEAVEFLEEALRIEPRYPLAHFMLGLIHSRRGAFREAAAHLREAVAQDPGFVEARYQLGVVLAQAGDLEGAAATLSQDSVLSSPFAVQAHHNLGVVLEQLGRREEAEAHYRQAGGRP